MLFMNKIIEYLSVASDFFYDIYLQVLSWVWPFWKAAGFFYELCLAFNSLAWRFYDFHEWVDDVWGMVQEILSWTNIKSLIKSWLPGIEALITWWGDWWNKVTGVINSWWNVTQTTVKGWIAAAIAGLEGAWEDWLNFWQNLWPSLVNSFNSLKAAWDNFWTTIFPNLVSFTWLTAWWNSRLVEIDALIDTWVKELAPFWEGWQEIRQQVLTFFSDPLEWLWARFADWFLGPE